jgi:hypothetical protein
MLWGGLEGSKEDMYEGIEGYLFMFCVLRREKRVFCARSDEDAGSGKRTIGGDKSANLKSLGWLTTRPLGTPRASRKAALGILLRF